MEWIILVLFAVGTSAFIALPRRADRLADDTGHEAVELASERENLLRMLGELDEDAAAGRISAEDRLVGRRALGPRLREVTEGLRDRDASGEAGGQ